MSFWWIKEGSHWRVGFSNLCGSSPIHYYFSCNEHSSCLQLPVGETMDSCCWCGNIHFTSKNEVHGWRQACDCVWWGGFCDQWVIILSICGDRGRDSMVNLSQKSSHDSMLPSGIALNHSLVGPTKVSVNKLHFEASSAWKYYNYSLTSRTHSSRYPFALYSPNLGYFSINLSIFL